MSRAPDLAVIDLPAPVPTVRSRRAGLVASGFGLELEQSDRAAVHALLNNPALDAIATLLPQPGEIVLITGASGSGKSSLLRAVRASAPRSVRWIDLARGKLPARPLVDCFGRSISLPRVLEMLARVGLAEAWTYLRTPAELSEGQRWRLRLALSLCRARRHRRCEKSGRNPVLFCDEFCAVLDRVTAAVVARTLRRSLGSSCAAILATSHEDLLPALRPDTIVRCDFGRITITKSITAEAQRRGGAPAIQGCLRASASLR